MSLNPGRVTLFTVNVPHEYPPRRVLNLKLASLHTDVRFLSLNLNGVTLYRHVIKK